MRTLHQPRFATAPIRVSESQRHVSRHSLRSSHGRWRSVVVRLGSAANAADKGLIDVRHGAIASAEAGVRRVDEGRAVACRQRLARRGARVDIRDVLADQAQLAAGDGGVVRDGLGAVLRHRALRTLKVGALEAAVAGVASGARRQPAADSGMRQTERVWLYPGSES